MPIEKQRGLEGIRRWDALSNKEKKKFLKLNPAFKDRSVLDVSNIYDNSLYVDRYGEEDFRAHPDKAWRDARLKSDWVSDAKKNLWGEGYTSLSDDANRTMMESIAGLSDDAFIQLAENKDFNFPTEIEGLESVEQSKNKLKKDNPYAGLLVDTMMNLSTMPQASMKGKSLRQIDNYVNDLHKNNTAILDKILAEDNRVKRSGEEMVTVSDSILNALDQMPAEKVEQEFKDVYEGKEVKTGFKEGDEADYKTEGFGLYKAFRDHPEMQGFGLYEKKRFLADYYAAHNLYGPAAAQSIMQTALQDYIYDQQTFLNDWVGSAARGATGKFVASFGQLGIGLQAFGQGTKQRLVNGKEAADRWVANFMEGKDENGEDRPAIDNINYWNGMDQYGCFSWDQIQAINANGGISPYNWLSRPGEEMSLESALNEGLKMTGYLAAQWVTAHGVGALGKGVAGKVGGVFNEATKLYDAAKSSGVANAIMKYATPGVSSALNAIPISVGYAKGSYDEVLRQSMERLNYLAEQDSMNKTQDLDARIKGSLEFVPGYGFFVKGNATPNDGETRQQGEDVEAHQMAAALNDWLQRNYGEGNITKDAGDEALANYMDFRRNQYLNEYKNGDVYSRLLDAARRSAASAYERNATIEWLRMCGVNYLFKQWQQDKSVRAAMNSNYPNLDAVDRAGRLTATGKILGMEVSPKLARFAQPAKSLWGGFESNYMDDVTAAYAKGFSLGRWNDYVDRVLMDPDNAAITMSWTAGFVNAIASAEDMFADKQAWYDGFIGALGSGEMIAPGVAARALVSKSARNGWSAKNNYSQYDLGKLASKYGLSLEEYIAGDFEESFRRRNPQLSDAKIKELADKARAEDGLQAAVSDGRIRRLSMGEKIDRFIYNPLLRQYSESAERERQYQDLIDAGNVGIANAKEAIEDMFRVVYHTNDRAVANKSQSTLRAKEAKAEGAYGIASLFSKWQADPIMSQSSFVQEAWAKLEDQARDKYNVTQEDIDDFYSAAENKSEAGRPDAEDFARERIHNNAQQIIRMKEAQDETLNRLKNSKQYRVVANHNAERYVAEQLAYNNGMLNNRTERKSQMEKELNLSPYGNFSPVAAYGSMAGVESAIADLQERIDKTDAAIERSEKLLEKPNKKASSSMRKLQSQSLRLQIQELERQKDDLRSQLRVAKDVQDADMSVVLTAEDILNLNPELRAKMLNDNNSSLYSAEQKKSIEEAKRILKQRDPDALEKVEDISKLQQMIDDTKVSSEIMEDNLEAAADYFEYKGRLRAEMIQNSLANVHYRETASRMEKAADTDERLRWAKTLSSKEVEKYISDHPNQDTDVLRNIQKVVEAAEDVDQAVIELAIEKMAEINERVRSDGKADTPEDVQAKKTERDLFTKTLEEVRKDINDNAVLSDDIQEDAAVVNRISEMANQQTDPVVKGVYDSILEKLERKNSTRSATVRQTTDVAKQQEAQRKQNAYNANGENFGWPGYVVGDTVYHKDGRQGKVSSFVAPPQGEAVGSMKVAWNGQTGYIVYTERDKDSISKDENIVNPQTKAKTADDIKKELNLQALNGIRKIVNADFNMDKLDGVVEYKVAVRDGADVVAENENIVNQAIRELREEGVNYEQYMVEPQTNGFPEEVVGDEAASWTPDGGLLVPTEQQQLEQAVALTETPAMEAQDGFALDKENENRYSKAYRQEPGLMEGNNFYEYVVNTLKNLGIIERRKAREKGDTLDKFFQWLDNKGIQLQEIIDRELSQLYRANPNLEIKFAISRDPLTSQQVLEVIEFTPEVEKIHDKSLGGVITMKDGEEEKRYLLVGTVYSHTPGMSDYNRIGNVLKFGEGKQYLDSHPDEEFYVSPNMHTKIAKMDAGRLVKMQRGESAAEYRTLSELMDDPIRNPNGLSLDEAILGIMYDHKWFVANRTVPNMFPPGKSDATLGRVFLMMPAANGNYIPVALKTDMTLNSPDLVEGRLTANIDKYIRQLASPELEARKDALKNLGRYLQFDSENGKVVNGFLVGTETSNNITLVLNGLEVGHWNIEGIDMMNFINTVKSSPFRINVTQRALSNTTSVKALDEAGVLKTDVSLLRTANVAYQIYEVGPDGSPLVRQVKQATPETRKISPGKLSTVTTIGKKTYRLIEGKYYAESNQEVTDPDLVRSIHYNLYIQQKGLEKFYSDKRGNEYYVVTPNKDNPVVVKKDTDNNITVLSQEKAKSAFEYASQQAEIERRRQAATEEWERIAAGQEGVSGEEAPAFAEETTKPTPAPAQPTQKTFIEPTHTDNVVYGPAIKQGQVWSKWDKRAIDVEYHTKTMVDAEGTKVTKMVGWSEGGAEITIPANAKEYESVPIPDGFAVPSEYAQNLVRVSMLEERADGTIKANIYYKSGLGFSSGWVALDKVDADAQASKPASQTPQQAPAKPKSDFDPNKATTKSLKDLQDGKNSTKFGVVFGKNRKAFMDLAKEKGWHWKNIAEAQSFIAEKLGPNFNPDSVTDVDTLLKDLKNCE